MKNSNYNTQHQFEALVSKERLRDVPVVNIRAGVRQELQNDYAAFESEDALDIIVLWFSGVRGLIATGLALASVVALGLVAYSQLHTLESSSVSDGGDQVASFIDNGDWSDLL